MMRLVHRAYAVKTKTRGSLGRYIPIPGTPHKKASLKLFRPHSPVLLSNLYTAKVEALMRGGGGAVQVA
jgi:hypothetical protein